MKTILCYGDSNTFGYNPLNGLRYDSESRWTALLQTMLGADYRVIEEGCNGRTTVMDDPIEEWKNGMEYLKPCLNSHKPVDMIILMLGSNDLKSCFGLTAKQIAENVGMLVDVTLSFLPEKQGYKPEIVVVSPPEVLPGISKGAFGSAFDEDAVARSKEFAHWYAKMAEEKGCRYLDAASYVKPSTIDCLHLTPESHKNLASALATFVRSLD